MTSHCIGLVDAIAPQQVDCGLLDRTHHAAVFLLLEHANVTPLCKPRTHPLSSFILSLLAPFYFGMVNCGGNTFQPVLVNAKSIDIVLQLLTCELVLVLVQLGQLHLHHACVCDWRLCLHQVCHHAKKFTSIADRLARFSDITSCSSRSRPGFAAIHLSKISV